MSKGAGITKVTRPNPKVRQIPVYYCTLWREGVWLWLEMHQSHGLVPSYTNCATISYFYILLHTPVHTKVLFFKPKHGPNHGPTNAQDCMYPR